MSRLKNLLNCLFFVLICLPISLVAQENPDHISVTVPFSGQESIIIESTISPTLLFVDQTSDWGDISAPTFLGDEMYEFIFTGGMQPGNATFTVEYYVPGPISFIPKPQYTVLELNTVASIVGATRDYVLIDSELSVDVLTNDNSTAGDLELLGTVLEQDVDAVTNVDEIDLFALSSEDKMYTQYLVMDTFGTHSNSVVVAIPNTVIDADQDKQLFTTNKSSVSFTLPGIGYTLNDNYGTTSGAIDQVNEYAYTYNPESNFSGLDSLQFVNTAGFNYTVYVKVYDTPYNNSFIRDDEFYTSKNTEISFNVYDNDLKEFTIIDYSEELEYIGDGEFTYLPPEGYYGVQNFFYTASDGLTDYTADISIEVNDQQPFNWYTYEFEGLANTPFVIDYKVPIEGTDWMVLSGPSNGSLNLLDEGETEEDSCYTISGLNKIVYLPNPGFVGEDAFDVFYCTAANACHQVRTVVTVTASQDSSGVCPCVDDCIWEGDANNDGKVSLADLQKIGADIGKLVPTKENLDHGIWYGQSGDTSDDAIHSDSNGDGVVTAEDIDAILENYGNMRSYSQYESLITDDYIIELETQEESVDSGEVLHINIIAGNDEFPAIDVHSFSFALNVSADLADSSSMQMHYLKSSWLNHNDPTVDLQIVPMDGRIETAITKTTGLNSSGQGIVAVLSFIVEEEVEGFRLEEGAERLISIDLTDVYASDANGRRVKLKDQSIQVPIRSKDDEKEELKETKNPTFLYPNPTSSELNIELLNQENIQHIEIYNLNGVLLQQVRNIDAQYYQLHVEQNPGLYLLKVVTKENAYTSKFEFFNK